MNPHLHITIVGLALLVLFGTYIMWSMRKLYNLDHHINMIEDFVKFKAQLDLAKNNPTKMVELYKDYIDAEA